MTINAARVAFAPFRHPFAAIAIVYFLCVIFVGLPIGTVNRVDAIRTMLATSPGWPLVSPERAYRARRDLLPNHRIAQDDLVRPTTNADTLGFYMIARTSLVGRYVVAKIASNHPVVPEALAGKPRLEMPDKTLRAVAYPLPSESALIALLDVDSPVSLVGQTSDNKAELSIDTTVHALLCDGGGAPRNCSVILRVTASDAAVAARNVTTLKLVLRSGP
jgi:hypothetical protein